jgi:1-acyl-sn-glycerol-3-phosphate acyltransferase
VSLPPPPDFRLLRRANRIYPAYRAYFRAQTRGFERLPPGAALLVGNHSGGFVMPEALLTVLPYHQATGFRDPLVILGHDLAFLPGLGRLTRRFGGTPARQHSALAALRGGRRVLVYPGGDHEVMRPSRDRHRIDFGQRTGFVKLALAAGAPVVPIVCAGAHNIWYVLSRGDRMARWLGLDRSPLRLGVFPLAISFPWGLTSGLLPFLPWPSKITTEVLEPIYLQGDPQDPSALEEGYRRVTQAMQAGMDRLRAEPR